MGTATADITIDSDGVSVEGEITAGDIAIPGVDWLTFTEGKVDFSGGVDGISASGTITGSVEALGTFELNLTFAEGVVSGDFTLTVREEGVPITEQAIVESGTLTGTFSPEGFDLTVNAHINVQDFCTADVEDMTYSMPDGILSGTIVAQQWPESFSLGETVEVSNTTVTVVVEENDLTSITGTACLLYTSPSPRDATLSRMPSSA